MFPANWSVPPLAAVKRTRLTVALQHKEAALDRGRTGIGIGHGQGRRAAAGLGQSARAADGGVQEQGPAVDRQGGVGGDRDGHVDRLGPAADGHCRRAVAAIRQAAAGERVTGIAEAQGIEAGAAPLRLMAVTEPEPLNVAESVFVKPTKVPGAACTPDPILSVQFPLVLQSEPPLLFQTPLPEKTFPVIAIESVPSGLQPDSDWLSPSAGKVTVSLNTPATAPTLKVAV